MLSHGGRLGWLNLYEEREQVGRGTFGQVFQYKLKDRYHNLDVPTLIAVKKARREEERDQTQVAREIDALMKMTHDKEQSINIVMCYNIERDNDQRLHILMELCDCSLADLMTEKKNAPFALQSFYSYAAQLAYGLDYLHRHDILHRDLKSGNILVFREYGLLKICDFGLSRTVMSEDSKSMSANTGTAEYMAPEVIDNYGSLRSTSTMVRYSKSADVFSLGVLFFEMLAGRRPFKMAELEKEEAPYANHPVDYLDTCGRLLKALLKWMLTWKQSSSSLARGKIRVNRRPAEKRPTAAEIIADLRQMHDIDKKMELLYERHKTMIQARNSEVRERQSKFKIDADPFTKILGMLGLSLFYPEQITLNDVRQRALETVTKMEDVPWFILQKMLSLDYRSLKGNFFPKPDAAIQANLQEEDEENPFQLQQPKVLSDLHPTDVFVTVFLCCSPLLRMILADKLFLCQISIPLILPDTNKMVYKLMLGSLRNIICANEAGREASIASHSCTAVSFINFENAIPNKERLLNMVFGMAGHSSRDIFRSYRNLEFSPQQISTGYVDMAVVLPSLKEKGDSLPTITLFYNIHGDVEQQELTSLFRLSSITVVIVSQAFSMPNPNIQKLIQSISEAGSKPIIVVYGKDVEQSTTVLPKINRAIATLNKQISVEKFLPKNGNIFLAVNKTAAAEKIIAAIRQCQTKTLMCLEQLLSFPPDSNDPLEVDEHSQSCSTGRTLADAILSLIDGKDLASAKNYSLAIQMLWRKWVELEKTLHRGSVEVDAETYTRTFEIKKKMQAIRNEQEEKCRHMSRLMSTFLSQFVALAKRPDNEALLFMLKWLQQGLDKLCRDTLPELRRSYKKLWHEARNLKAQNKPKNELQEMEDKLRDLEAQLADSSLGLEHFMREMAQIYETTRATRSSLVGLDIDYLPGAVADLILAGHNLELIDGDASHVPIAWVTAVLDKLTEKVGEDKKIFVLSILGLQSSGKSTLLNAMFGLQFAVSAGRCTRGVYGQLIPACQAATPGIDYIFVMDTEGLRAPETGSDKYLHDHEIATFVIGLGDATIINIQGELVGDMRDVLQIVVACILENFSGR